MDETPIVVSDAGDRIAVNGQDVGSMFSFPNGWVMRFYASVGLFTAAELRAIANHLDSMGEGK